MLNLALFIGWIIRFRTDMLPSNIQLDLSDLLFSPASIILTFCWIVLFFANDLYRMRWDISRFDHVRRVSKVITFGILILFLITLDPENLFSEGRLTTLLYGFLLLITVNSGRLIVIGIEKYFSALEYAPHNTLLIGTTDKARKLLKDIHQNPHLLYNIVGYVSREPSDKIFYSYKCLGRYSQIPEIIRSFNIEEVIIAINERSRDEILNIVSMAEGIKVNFKILPQIYDVVSGHKTEEVIGHPLIRLFPDRMRLWQWITKRLIDITLSASLLLLISPIFLIVFLLLWLSGIHPPLVYINIVGKNKQVFGMLNFETDKKDSPKQPLIGRLLEITRFYKFPSLVNILLGKMSFVGPRPENESDVEQVSQKIKFYNRRFEVKPGLTGWAQVKYRYEEALKHKRDQFKQDLFYLENMSITFDIRIILRSILIFLLRR
jgi:lipopolysaccharide/colanic/teichoic acid biosynthesis glycosyltransferase